MGKFIVTGGAGFIGSHIAEKIVRDGHNVIIIDDLTSGNVANFKDWWNPNLCEHSYRSISNYESILPLFEGVDGVFHNAASKCTVCMVDPLVDLVTNAYGTLNVCRAASIHGVKRVIHASTGSVKDGNPVSYYGNSKLAAENYVKIMTKLDGMFNYTILRYYNVYGTRQNNSDTGGVIPIFIRNILDSKPIIIYGDGKQVRHFTTVSDVVKANILAYTMNLSAYKTYNIVSDVTMSINELVKLICKVMGKTDYPIECRRWKPGDIRRFDVVNYDTKKDFNITFDNDVEKNLYDIVKWYTDRHISEKSIHEETRESERESQEGAKA